MDIALMTLGGGEKFPTKENPKSLKTFRIYLE
jgi:hypothetical protein